MTSGAAGLSWVLSLISMVFGLLEISVFGIPLYVFVVGVFVFGLVAKFIEGVR